jgi:hypothetical protein
MAGMTRPQQLGDSSEAEKELSLGRTARRRGEAGLGLCKMCITSRKRQGALD